MPSPSYTSYATPIGYIRIEYSGNKLFLLQIIPQTAHIELGTRTDFTEKVYTQIMEYIRCERSTFDIELDLSSCTAFKLKVYEELMKIPYGEKRSYKDIATAIGNSQVARAVGMANNKNPIHIIIPCHRVVGASGALIGYKAGVETQDFLLELERLAIMEGMIEQ